VNDLVLEFLAEIDDWPALRKMRDDEIAESFQGVAAAASPGAVPDAPVAS
jgi:hypothetical protein